MKRKNICISAETDSYRRMQCCGTGFGYFFHIRIRIFILMRIRILLLIKVTDIWDHWSTDPPRLHSEPSRLRYIVSGPGPLGLHFEPPQRLNLGFEADPTLRSDADLDPKMKRIRICNKSTMIRRITVWVCK